MIIGIVITLLVGVVSACLLAFFGDMLTGITDVIFYIEKGVFNALDIDMAGISGVVFSFAISFLILKFLKKGFDIYVGWYDGDKDANPMNLVIGFTRAIVAMCSFQLFYDILAKVTKALIDESFMGLNMSNSMSALDALIVLAQDSIYIAIISLVLTIIYFLLYLRFISYGAELFLMRLFVPIACVGLIDSDKGMFSPYVKEFFTVSATVVFQLIALKLSIVAMFKGQMIFSLAFAMTAIRAPRLISKFIISSGGGVLNNVYYMKGLATSISRLARKR